MQPTHPAYYKTPLYVLPDSAGSTHYQPGRVDLSGVIVPVTEPGMAVPITNTSPTTGVPYAVVRYPSRNHAGLVPPSWESLTRAEAVALFVATNGREPAPWEV